MPKTGLLPKNGFKSSQQSIFGASHQSNIIHMSILEFKAIET